MSAWLEPLDPGDRCRRWKLRWTRGGHDGRHSKSRRFNGTKREAAAALREFECECNALPDGSSTFASWVGAWNDARLSSGSITQGTHEKYVWHLRAVTPLLPTNLADIRPSDVMAAYATLKTERNWTGTTLRALHNSMLRIFRAAVDDGLLSRSPMEGVDAPQIDTRPKCALSPAEAARVLDALNVQDARQFAVSLILRCGLRRGEVLGLEWRDVANGIITVRREITKSAAGARTLPISQSTAAMVDERRRIVSASLATASAELQQNDRLCCGLDGRPLSVSALRKWWERHRGDYGLDGWTLHELRHTYLTNLAQANVHPAIMQRLAGHSSPSTTMAIYTHVAHDDLARAADALDSLRNV